MSQSISRNFPGNFEIFLSIFRALKHFLVFFLEYVFTENI
jgi:hypothetical protein